MPPKKKQRTEENSVATTQEHEDEPQEEQPEAESSNAQDVVELDGGGDDESSDDEGPPLCDVRALHKLSCTYAHSDHPQTKNIPDHEYIGMPRPHFDYEAENRTLGEDSKEDEDFADWYKAGFKADNEAGVILEPAKDHPDHRWVIMWEGYKMFMDYCRGVTTAARIGLACKSITISRSGDTRS